MYKKISSANTEGSDLRRFLILSGQTFQHKFLTKISSFNTKIFGSGIFPFKIVIFIGKKTFKSARYKSILSLEERADSGNSWLVYFFSDNFCSDKRKKQMMKTEEIDYLTNNCISLTQRDSNKNEYGFWFFAGDNDREDLWGNSKN